MEDNNQRQSRMREKRKNWFINYKVDDDWESRDALIRSYIHTAEHYAMKYSLALDMPLEDLLSYSYEGIILGIDRSKLSDVDYLDRKVVLFVRHSLCEGVTHLLGISRRDYYVFKELKAYIEKDLGIPFEDTLDTYELFEKVDDSELFEDKFLVALKNRCKLRDCLSYEALVDSLNKKLDDEEKDEVYTHQELSEQESELLGLYSAFSNVVLTTILKEETRESLADLLNLLTAEEKNLIIKYFGLSNDEPLVTTRQERDKIWNIVKKLNRIVKNDFANKLHISKRDCNLNGDEFYDRSPYHRNVSTSRKRRRNNKKD